MTAVRRLSNSSLTLTLYPDRLNLKISIKSSRRS
jgi:hypothetical protein